MIIQTPDNKIEITTDREDGTKGEVFIGIEYENYYDHSMLTAGVSLSPAEAYEAILAIADAAGLTTDPTGAGTGIIIQRPVV
jgi:hypothetical protein